MNPTLAVRALRRVASTVLALVVLSAPAGAQQYRFAESGMAAEIGRAGSAIVLEATGPRLPAPREIYRPVPPLELRHRWVMLQDESLGVAFGAPSGVTADREHYDGEVRIRALDDVRAIEVRALVFNVWGDLSDYLTITLLDDRQVGDAWVLQPRWSDAEGADAHRTTIMWVNRVMFADESVAEVDADALALAWSHVTGMPYEDLGKREPVAATGRQQ